MITDEQSLNMMSEKQVKVKKKRHWFSILINLIIFGVAIFFSFRFFVNSEHKKIEKNMVEAAKTYLEQNTNRFSQEEYVTVGKFGFSVPSNCSELSGVLYDGERIIPYLSCSEYESDLEDNEVNKKYITLNGSGIVILLKGMKYEEPGYVSSGNVKIFGNVGEDEGVYTLYYNDETDDKIVQRKVIVISNNTLTNQFPKITLNGPSVKYVVVNTSFDESDVVATDEVDGEVTNKIKRLGKVDTKTIGDYPISYVINNSRGYRVYAKRTVKVVDHIVNLDVTASISPSKKTNGTVTISINVEGDSFGKTVFPDGTISNNKNSEYTVNENGTYKFVIYDKADLSVEKEVVVDNIDKELPDAICKTTVFASRSKTMVTVSSSRGIESYEYILDGVSSTPIKDDYYESDTKPTKVNVIVKDIRGSENEIECTVQSPQVYTDSTGKNCIEGYTCYIQFNYSSEKYPYCSMTTENSCGTISRNGCSITSATIAIASFGIKSSSGNLYNPYSVWEELYQIDKRTGYCDAACSSWTRIKGAIRNAGLSTADKAKTLSRDQASQEPLIEHLKKGYPAVIHANKGPYAKGGHYMVLIGIRESDNYVFLSDPAMWSGTYKDQVNGRKYYVDTYIPIDDLIAGAVDNYLLVGPPGYVF